MAKIIIECAPHLVETFCAWFSNQGEQDFMEAYADGGWNPETMSYDERTTGITVKGYGVNEPIRLVEYDKETNEEIDFD